MILPACGKPARPYYRGSLRAAVDSSEANELQLFFGHGVRIGIGTWLRSSSSRAGESSRFDDSRSDVSHGIADALATIVRKSTQDPPVYLVDLLFSLKGLKEFKCRKSPFGPHWLPFKKSLAIARVCVIISSRNSEAS